MDTRLRIRTEVVQAHQMSDKALLLISAIAKEHGRLDDYIDYKMGSGYFVELPRYVDFLLAGGRDEEAENLLHRCFGDNGSIGISKEDWRTMEAAA